MNDYQSFNDEKSRNEKLACHSITKLKNCSLDIIFEKSVQINFVLIGTMANSPYQYFYHSTPPPSPEPPENYSRKQNSGNNPGGRNFKRFTQRAMQLNSHSSRSASSSTNHQPVPDNYGGLGGPSRRSRAATASEGYDGSRKNQVRT